MKNYFKSELKHIPMMLLICIVFYGLKVLADSYALSSTEVSFDNTGTNITATNLQNAINETFLHATDYNEIKTTIGSGTLNTTSQNLIGAVNELKGSVTSLNNQITNIDSDLAKSTSLITTAQTVHGAINEVENSINYQGLHFQNIRLGNNSEVSFNLLNRDLWLLYRSYQPNLLKIGSNGAVEIGFGKNESITITASNNVVTIKNTIGWAVNYIAFIAGS